ncbi:MAG: hypothetical protein WDM90_16145 [Ferruginibacter sp.]
MKFSEVIYNLYCHDNDKIIETINLSLWAKDYPFDKNDCLIIHTGFIFEMQKSKKIELFYDFRNEQIIRQTKFSDNPSVLGLVHLFWNDWIKIWEHKMVISFNEVRGEIVVSSFENAEEVFDYKDFEIIPIGNSETILMNQLERNFEKELRFDGDRFEETNDEDE